MGSEENEDEVQNVNDCRTHHEPKRIAKHGQPLRRPVVLSILQWQNIMAKFEMVLDPPGYQCPQIACNCGVTSHNFMNFKILLMYVHMYLLDLFLRAQAFQR